MENKKEITREQLFFIQCISDFVNGDKTVIPDGIDMDTLLNLSVEQQCQGIMYYQTKIPLFEKPYSFVCFQSVQLKKLQSEINRTFCENNIEYLIFKGPETAKYYTIPNFRTMGDLDILVHSDDKSKARQALLDIGCTTDDSMPENHEWIFYNKKNEIELHHKLLYNCLLNEEKLVEFTDTVWENAEKESDGNFLYHLKPEFLFIYTLLHLRKHILWAGMGIRQFLDLAMMIKNADLNWEYISETMTDLSLEKFAGICFALIDRWFGVKAPVFKAEISEEFFLNTTEEVLERGVQGLHGITLTTMEVNHYANKFKTEKNTIGKRFAEMINVFFPPFSYMKEKYPKMAEYPILLPVMWIRRFIDAVKEKRAGSSFNYAVTPVMIGKQIDDRQDKLKEWGIESVSE